ncbi:ubiquitin specific protease 16/45 isoform X2 [Halictus rubicundus]|uniref:ubiquitin specific protease 16/45 isoform X2 n=1 Tax=Halictus rubicundus TaxID=77578 RepID=UPI00403722F9
MSKKRTRQPDANEELIERSSDSCDESSSTGNKCPHIAKAVNFNKVKKYINKVGSSVECSDCKKNKSNSLQTNEEASTESSTIFVCLLCGHQGCKKEECEHAMEHYKKPHSDCHYIAVNTHSWDVWCYECNAKVTISHRNKLQETVEFVKRAATVNRVSPQTNTALCQFQKEAVDTDVQKEKVSHDNLPKVGGLMNLGNTCFFNAVLQCLAQTPFLVKVLSDLNLPGQKFVLPGGKHKVADSSEEVNLPPIEGTLESWGNFTSVLYTTLVEMQNSDGQKCYRPSELLNSFKKKTMQCMDGGQHDSHELLRHLLELVRNEDVRRYQLVILKQIGLNQKTNPEVVEKSLKSRIKFYGNQASARLLGPEPVFRGVLVSTLECLDCHHSSQSTEPFLDLSLSVMADKPQPRIVKKNSAYEDTFDILENNISRTPSKHQLLKKEKKARKNRRSKIQEPRDYSNDTPNKSNIIEENNGSIIESEESDADVEDNVEIEAFFPEIVESGYSSEKQSTLASPASPATDPSKADEIMNKTALDNYLQFRPINNIPPVQEFFNTNSSHRYVDNCAKVQFSPIKNLSPIEDFYNRNSSHSLHPTDITIKDLSQTKVLNRLNNSDSPINETGIQTGFSLSTSLTVNPDLTSPKEPAVNLSSATSKESSCSPILAFKTSENAIENIERPASRLNLVESVSHNEQEDAAYNQRGRRNAVEYSNEVCNGVNGISYGISKMGLGNQASPIRYTTKEGECSIQSCLNQFTALELMDGSNKVSCEACTARERKVKENCKMICTPSTKQYLISRVPAVLILHLKRFQAQRIDFRKVTRHVSFPILLDLSPICKNHKKPKMYSLYGVVEHSGTIHGGHYVAYVKSRSPLTSDDPRWSFLPSKDAQETEESSSSQSSDSEGEEAAAASHQTTVEPPPGKWYYVSDSRVTEVDETTVLRSQAYLLFYERIL